MMMFGGDSALALARSSYPYLSSFSYSSSYDPITRGIPELFVALLVAGFMLFAIITAARVAVFRFLERPISVIKLQVGLLVSEPSLQRNLNQIAETADTSTSSGWINILKGTTESLLQNFKHFMSCHSSVDVKKSLEDAGKCFRELSIEERAKFDRETLVNFNNVKKKSMNSPGVNQFINTYMVVTILIAANGVVQLPAVRNGRDLKRALKKIQSIHTSGKSLAMNVSWTPQEENDILTLEELEKDYPLLKLLGS